MGLFPVLAFAGALIVLMTLLFGCTSQQQIPTLYVANPTVSLDEQCQNLTKDSSAIFKEFPYDESKCVGENEVIFVYNDNGVLKRIVGN